MPATMTVPTVEEIKELLKSIAGRRARERALLVLLARQTADERAIQQTVEHNGVGFTGWDAEMLTSMATQVEENRYARTLGARLTDRQHEVLVKRLPKYARQLREAAEQKADMGRGQAEGRVMIEHMRAVSEVGEDERAMQRMEAAGDRAQTARDAARAAQADVFAACPLCHGNLTIDANVGGEVEERPCPRCVRAR